MTTKEIAEGINGIGYRKEPSEAIIQNAKDAGIVIVYGASDDLMEFRGAEYDEIGCYDGGTAYFNSEGLVRNKCADDECPHFKEARETAATIEALWAQEEGYSWTYKTDIPHETFEILEDSEPFCRGIVFKLSDVKRYVVALADIKTRS